MSKNERITVKQLSSGVLDMKFMLRTKKRLECREKKKKDLELQKTFQDSQKVSDQEATSSKLDEKAALESRYNICNDYAKLEDLLFGRMSFKGQNQEVEELMVYYERLKNGELSDEEEDTGKDIKDEEMAKSLSKKFMSKRQRQQAEMENKEIASSSRFNFSDIRKRGADSELSESPKRKFRKPAD